MRQLWRPVGLVAFVCAFALLSTSAMAAEFHASFSGKTRGKNVEEAPQAFKFGSVNVTCLKAWETGEVLAGSSKTLFDKVTYGKCTSEAKMGGEPIHLRATFKTPIDFEYHANGYAEFGGSSEGELKLETPGPIELKIGAIQCMIEIPPQTIPVKAINRPDDPYSSVTFATEEFKYTNKTLFPSGFQKKILIENSLKAIEYEATAGQCSEFTKHQGKGTYNGAFLDELIKGDLSYE